MSTEQLRVGLSPFSASPVRPLPQPATRVFTGEQADTGTRAGLAAKFASAPPPVAPAPAPQPPTANHTGFANKILSSTPAGNALISSLAASHYTKVSEGSRRYGASSFFGANQTQTQPAGGAATARFVEAVGTGAQEQQDQAGV